MADGYGFAARRRLENRRAGARDESDGQRPEGRHLVHGGLHLSFATRAIKWCWARTCWRFARASRTASLRWRCIRWASAARRTRRGWCSTRPPGPALNAAMMDLGNRFRLLINEVDVRRAGTSRCRNCRWRARSGNAGRISRTRCAAWIYAGGAHHTGFSQAVTTEMLEDFAAIAGIGSGGD